MSPFRSLILAAASLLCCALLTGCWEEKPVYSYLMLHPDYLQRNYNQCVQQVVDPALPCETILRAQADFTALTNEREQDPERFGARVMQAQENTVYLKRRFESTLGAYQKAGRAKPSVEAFKEMRMELDKRRAQYKASKNKVNFLLSVIAATSMI